MPKPKIDRTKFLLLLFAGTIQYDRKYKKTLSLHIMNCAYDLPESLFNQPNYNEFSYVANILDFEYGSFDATGDEYPEWVSDYFDWKSSGRSKKHDSSCREGKGSR